MRVEALAPDFKGDEDCIAAVLESGVDVFAHNVETVPRLYRQVRPDACYVRSMQVLRQAKLGSARVRGSPPPESSPTRGEGKKVEPGGLAPRAARCPPDVDRRAREWDSLPSPLTREGGSGGETDPGGRRQQAPSDLQAALLTKSGIMLGLGEQDEEVLAVLRDLREAMVDIVTIGQYLRPTPKQLPVVEYVRPEKFEFFAEQARAMGFRLAVSGPLVRSSYRAEEAEGLLDGANVAEPPSAVTAPMADPEWSGSHMAGQ